MLVIDFFTTTVEILARSLANVSSIRVQTDKILINAKIHFSCQTVNFLTNEILARKAIDDVRVNFFS